MTMGQGGVFGYPGGLPGQRYSGGPGRLAQLLAMQKSSNNGTTAGGLGHMLQQFMLGKMMREQGMAEKKAVADESAAMQAMTQGMSAKPWTPPDEMIHQGSPTGPMMPRQDAMDNASPAGGYAGALAALGGLQDNPYAGRLSQQLAMKQSEHDMALADAAQKRDADLTDYRIKKDIDQKYATPKAPTPHSDVAKIHADVRSGLMTPQEGEDALKRLQQPGGAFDGKGMDAQYGNIVLGYADKKARGLPTTPEEDRRYAFAHRQLSKARLFQTPDGRQYTMPGVNLEGYPAPIMPGGVGQDALPMKGQPGMRAQPAIQQQAPGAPAQPNGMPPGAQQVGSQRFNDGQMKAANFANRMSLATKEVDQVVSGPDGVMGTADDYNPANTLEHMRASLPTVGGVDLGNMAASPEFQRMLQAQRNWVSANLRQESGAAIPPEEMDNEIKKYFPQAGDSQPVLEQKARARKVAEQGMVAQSQGAYEARFGATPPAISGGGMAPGTIIRNPTTGDVLEWNGMEWAKPKGDAQKWNGLPGR
jgi:hypothetical protein